MYSTIKRIVLVAPMLLFASNSWSADSVTELQEKLDQAMDMILSLQQELEELRQTDLVEQTVTDSSVQSDSEIVESVDLTFTEVGSVDQPSVGHVLENPWWRNIEIYGFGAAGYYDTASGGTKDTGGFEVKESSLFIEADVWEDIGFFIELQTNRLGKDDSLFSRTGEVYAHFRNVQIFNDTSVNLKVGRFDIPFGEEYLWQDSIDNPLITNSVAYPYGWDEGVLLYGDVGSFGWIGAISDGTDARSIEENSDKAYNFKIFSNPTEQLYLSASLMLNGGNTKSAFEFGGSHFQPVGASHFSSLGKSASREVDSSLFQLDARHNFRLGTREGYLAAFFGVAEQDDVQREFDRELRWFSIEPYLQLSPNWYTVLRYSEIGTYDSQEGYHFDGKVLAGGNSAFGYDTKRFQRLGVGLGWTPNPRVRGKLEIGKDRFELIDATTLPVDSDSRSFVGVEFAVGF